jgi:hypothetical protein
MPNTTLEFDVGKVSGSCSVYFEHHRGQQNQQSFTKCPVGSMGKQKTKRRRVLVCQMISKSRCNVSDGVSSFSAVSYL